eukprot:1401845-Rhodomonas_salina.1
MDRVAHLRKVFIDPRQAMLAVRLGIVSVFRYSARVVPWTPTELQQITWFWTAAAKVAWRLPAACPTS